MTELQLEVQPIVIAAHEFYVEGRRYRVARDDARLEGMQRFGTSDLAWAGYSKRLQVGDILTCTGWKLGWADSQVKIPNFTCPGVPPEAKIVHVWPFASLFTPYPLAGLLELIEEES